MAGIFKGVAFVEFQTVEYAAHTLRQASSQLDRSLKINFGKENFVSSMPMQVVHQDSNKNDLINIRLSK